MKDLIVHYEARGMISSIESCIPHVDVGCLDVHQVCDFCTISFVCVTARYLNFKLSNMLMRSLAKSLTLCYTVLLSVTPILCYTYISRLVLTPLLSLLRLLRRARPTRFTTLTSTYLTPA